MSSDLLLVTAVSQSIRSQFLKLEQPETRQAGIVLIHTAVRQFAKTVSGLRETSRAHGEKLLNDLVSELKYKYNVHVSYQLEQARPPISQVTASSTRPSLVVTFLENARADIAKLKTLPLGDPLRDSAVERVRIIIKYLKDHGVDASELEGEFATSFPRNERARTVEQVSSFFRKFGQTFSSDATQPQSEITLDRIQDMLRRLEPSVAEIVATSANKTALKKSSEALDTLIPVSSSEPVRGIVRATRYTSFKIAKSTHSEVVRVFMLLVNMFLTFKVAVLVAVYTFLMTTPVLAPTSPGETAVFDAREQSSLLTLAFDEAYHSVNKVLEVLQHGPWGESDAVVLEYGRTKLCGVLAEEAAITREEELLVNPYGGAFMRELENVCNNQGIWANEAAAADFFRDSMIGAGCVRYDPFQSLLELSGECPAPENPFVNAAILTTNQLKQSEGGLLMWVGASVLSITLILSGVGSSVSFGKKWSAKYKRSINCRKPKGFSQKQYCTYGRRK